jgi:hypothetical protein
VKAKRSQFVYIWRLWTIKCSIWRKLQAGLKKLNNFAIHTRPVACASSCHLRITSIILSIHSKISCTVIQIIFRIFDTSRFPIWRKVLKAGLRGDAQFAFCGFASVYLSIFKVKVGTFPRHTLFEANKAFAQFFQSFQPPV